MLLPLIDSLRELGTALGCNECEDRRERQGAYCDACPLRRDTDHTQEQIRRDPRRERDDSIVLL
jgi:hypothetical protein